MLVIYIRIKKSDGSSLSIKPDEMSDEKPVAHDDLLSYFFLGAAFSLFREGAHGQIPSFYV